MAPTSLFADEDDDSVAAEMELAKLDRGRPSLASLDGNVDSDETAVVRRMQSPFQLLDSTASAARPVARQSRRPSGVALQSIPRPESVPILEESEPTAPVSQSPGRAWLAWLGVDEMWATDADTTSSYIPSPTVPRDGRFAAVGRLVNHYGFRQLRKIFRSQLRDRVEQDPTYQYLDYLAERERVSHLGRSVGRDGSLEVAETRRTVLASRDSDSEDAAEVDLAVLSWGPFQVDDRGRLQIELEKLREEPPSSVDALEIAPEATEKPLGDSLFRGRNYRVNTALKLRPRLDRYDEGMREVLGEVGARIEVDFFSPILERRYLGTEFETTIDEEGRTAFFVTFKLYQQ